MVSEMNNSSAVDIATSWSVDGRMRHVDMHNYFLRKLKDQGLLATRHISGELIDADIFTKNVTSAVVDRHIPLYVGHDEYLRVRDSSGEAVGKQNHPNSEEGKQRRVLRLAGLRQDRIPEPTKIVTQDSPSDIIVESKT